MTSSSHHHPSVAVEADDSQYTYTTTTPQTAQPFGVYTRYGSYASYTLANYNAQRSAAFFGTVPRYAVDLSAACVDETQYQHPDALSSGLVVPADEFVSHEVRCACCRNLTESLILSLATGPDMARAHGRDHWAVRTRTPHSGRHALCSCAALRAPRVLRARPSRRVGHVLFCRRVWPAHQHRRTICTILCLFNLSALSYNASANSLACLCIRYRLLFSLRLAVILATISNLWALIYIVNSLSLEPWR